MENEVKAVGLVSGGLDSLLSVRLVQEQGIRVTGVHVATPFESGFGVKTREALAKMAQDYGFELKIVETGPEYLDLLKHPTHKFGKNLNPCIDCHILMLRIAGRIMEEEGAAFVFTGEVLNQRGKSQVRHALGVIEEECGLKGKLLRPLSALVLPETDVEKAGLVDRSRLLGLHGRERKVQLALAEEKGLKYYSAPAGGCLLTNAQFCVRLEELMSHTPDLTINDCLLLQVGRHFRLNDRTKLIVARNAVESEAMLGLAGSDDYLISSEQCPGLLGLLRGDFSDTVLELVGAYAPDYVTVFQVKHAGRVSEKTGFARKGKEEFKQYLI